MGKKLTTKKSEKIFEKISLYSIEGNTEVNSIASMFMESTVGVHNDGSVPAPAAIDMKTSEIVFNPNLIARQVWNIIYNGPEGDDPIKRITPYLNINYEVDEDSLIKNTFFLLKRGLILHEIGHYMYSAPFNIEWDNYTKYCPNIKISPEREIKPPFELVKFISNVVEDSFIQTALMRDYPNKVYKDALYFLQAFGQSDWNGTYEKALEKEKNINIKRKLYYFILRAYHPYDNKIISFYNKKEKLGWSNATIESFSHSCIIPDTFNRNKYVMEVVTPLVFKDLIEIVKEDPNKFISSDNPEDLLDEDKLRLSEEQKSQGEGEGDSQQQDSQESQDGNQNSSNSGEKEDQGQKSQEGQGQKEEKEEKEGEGENKESQGEDSQESQDGNQNSSNSKKTTQGEISEEQLKAFEKAVEDACKELNQSLGEEGKEREDASESLKKLSEEEKNNFQLEVLGCKVEDNSYFLTETASLSEEAKELYENCSIAFQKLYNNGNITIHNLDNGDIDQSTMISWYTEKNHYIYKREEINLKEREFQIIFALDDSGSMTGKQFNTASEIVAALSHAMDDVGIPTSIYLFSSQSRQIKTLEDPLILEGAESNVLNLMQQFQQGGGTSPVGVFEALSFDPVYEEDKTKILFFLTDGEFYKEDYKRIKQIVTDLTDRGNWFFYSIGLKLPNYAIEALKEATSPGVVKNYSYQEIVDNLGEDIYNTIIDDFIKA